MRYLLLACLLFMVGCSDPYKHPDPDHVHTYSTWSEPIQSENWQGNEFYQFRLCTTCAEAQKRRVE